MTDDVFLVLHLVKQYEPITRDRLESLSGLSRDRFKIAMRDAKPYLWQVGFPGHYKYEKRTETAVL